jgi:hypothetical protein
VLKNNSALVKRKVVPLMVEGGSHCQDMGQTSSADSASMAVVKATKAALIRKWLEEEDESI